MIEQREQYYEELSRMLEMPVMAYVTGDRRGLECQIGQDATDVFVDHLDKIGIRDKLCLILHTNGGDTMAAWSLINQLKIFADSLHVVVPRKALSSGTLMSLGAESIIMTKQAVLGPIDPSINTPLNPQVQAGNPNARVPVSVEALNGYIEYARETLGERADLSGIFMQLSQQIHPLVLGSAFRSRSQIRMLATNLLKSHDIDVDTKDSILKFLCSDSGSHDYSINRREAKDFGLPARKPSPQEYEVIKNIYDDFATELDFADPYDPQTYLGTEQEKDYKFARGLVESSGQYGHVFWTEGRLVRQQMQVPGAPPQITITDQRRFDGWRKNDSNRS